MCRDVTDEDIIERKGIRRILAERVLKLALAFVAGGVGRELAVAQIIGRQLREASDPALARRARAAEMAIAVFLAGPGKELLLAAEREQSVRSLIVQAATDFFPEDPGPNRQIAADAEREVFNAPDRQVTNCFLKNVFDGHHF